MPMNNFDYHLLANFQDFFIRHRGVYIYLIIINLVTFAVFGIDKFNAIHHRSRIREVTLFRLSLIGGSIGATALPWGTPAAWAQAQTLRAGVTGFTVINTLDPAKASLIPENYIMYGIFNALLKFNDKMEVVGDLAESFQSIDANTLEFKLRRGVKFQDGSDFTADDVKFSIERVADKLVDGSLAAELEPQGSDDTIGALNTAFAADGYFVDIAAGSEMDAPVEIQNAQAGGQVHVRVPVRVGDGAKAVIVEHHTGTEAALVLACRSTVTTTRSIGRCSFFAVPSRIRRLAWCGTTQATSSALRPAAASVSVITAPERTSPARWARSYSHST